MAQNTALSAYKAGQKSVKNGNGKKKNGKMTVPLAVVAGFAPGVWRMWEKRGGGLNLMANEAGRIYLGYDSWTGSFGIGSMKFGTLPILLGLGVHWLIGGKLGVNRMLAKAKIPFIRL